MIFAIALAQAHAFLALFSSLFFLRCASLLRLLPRILVQLAIALALLTTSVNLLAAFSNTACAVAYLSNLNLALLSLIGLLVLPLCLNLASLGVCELVLLPFTLLFVENLCATFSSFFRSTLSLKRH